MTPDISFCMIVRNGAGTLQACLKSVSAIADELIVVDGGSTDESVAVAQSFGATVLSVPWKDDFAAARNEYLKVARCAWVLSLDADEVLEPVGKATVRQMLTARPTSAFVFNIRNYFILSGDAKRPPASCEGVIMPGVGYTTSRTVRLLPRRRGIEYRYPVHESLIPALQEQRIPLRRCPIPIHHMGSLNGDGDHGAKATAYRRLGLKKVAQYPRYFLGHFELGKVFLHDGELDEATRSFEECVRLNPGYPRAYYYLALTYIQRNRDDLAMQQLQRGLRLFPRDSDMRELGRTVERRLAAASREIGAKLGDAQFR